MKPLYSLIIFVVIMLIVAGIFFFTQQKQVDQIKTVGNILECHVDKISDNVLALEANTTLMRTMISFEKIPLEQTMEDKLDELGITIHRDTWIFDYVVADIPTDSLCSLVKEENVKKVFIPESIK